MSDYKLTIELVPSSSWFDNVRSALSKSEWDNLKKIVYKKANYVCEICGGVGDKHPVECHEIWEYNDKKLTQKLSGMIALCPDCHMVKHIGLAQIQGKYSKALNHFKKINKVSEKKANLYISECFILWNSRSSKKWTLDISHLSAYNIDVDKIIKK